MELARLAGITEAGTAAALIQQWDSNSVNRSEKASRRATMGLNRPWHKKNYTHVIPEISEERRIEFTKVRQEQWPGSQVSLGIRHIRVATDPNISKRKRRTA